MNDALVVIDNLSSIPLSGLTVLLPRQILLIHDSVPVGIDLCPLPLVDFFLSEAGSAQTVGALLTPLLTISQGLEGRVPVVVRVVGGQVSEGVVWVDVGGGVVGGCEVGVYRGWGVGTAAFGPDGRGW